MAQSTQQPRRLSPESDWRPGPLDQQIDGVMLAASLQHLSYGEAVAAISRRAIETNDGVWDAAAAYAGWLLCKRVHEGAGQW